MPIQPNLDGNFLRKGRFLSKIRLLFQKIFYPIVRPIDSRQIDTSKIETEIIPKHNCLGLKVPTLSNISKLTPGPCVMLILVRGKSLVIQICVSKTIPLCAKSIWDSVIQICVSKIKCWLFCFCPLLHFSAIFFLKCVIQGLGVHSLLSFGDV